MLLVKEYSFLPKSNKPVFWQKLV